MPEGKILHCCHVSLLLHCSKGRTILSILRSGPEVIKHFLCSTQLSMKFFMIINHKLLTTAKFFLLNMAEHKIVSLSLSYLAEKNHAKLS